jgi:hypothetical protein
MEVEFKRGRNFFGQLLGDLKPFDEAGTETVCKQLPGLLNRSEHYYFQVAISSGISTQVLGGERFVQSYAYELAIYFTPMYVYISHVRNGIGALLSVCRQILFKILQFTSILIFHKWLLSSFHELLISFTVNRYTVILYGNRSNDLWGNTL